LSTNGGWDLLARDVISSVWTSCSAPRHRFPHQLTGDPPAGDVVKLANTDEWRLRASNWRVRFERDAETGVVNVLRVLPRDLHTGLTPTRYAP
jgi:hypothetical protein